MWEEFSQKEQLTTRLSNIIREYPLGAGSLVEFVQNADDAGATRFALVLDKHGSPHSHTSSITPSFTGRPFLAIYNDAVFSDKDFDSITKIGLSGKRNDLTKVGKWGLGFNVVYHFSDVVSFLSRDQLVIFDPHGDYLPEGMHGLRSNFVEKKLAERFPDQFAWLQGMDEVFSFQGTKEPFQGTLFHLPLRTAQDKSLISDYAVSPSDLDVLLDEFANVAQDALLFLKHVEEISILERNPDTGKLMPRFQAVVGPHVGSETEGDAVQLFRESRAAMEVFASNPESLMEITSMEYHMRAKWFGTKENSAKWLVVSGPCYDSNVLELAKSNNQVPFCSVAAKIDPRDGTVLPVDGRAYCVLPLPISTGLPVHVNALFAVSSNRRELERDDGVLRVNSAGNGKWNEYLVEFALPVLYSTLMTRLAVHGSRCDASLWPTEGQSIFRKLQNFTLHDLVNNNRKVFQSPSGSFFGIQDALLKDELFEDSPEITDALRACGIQVVDLPQPVRRAIAEAGCEDALRVASWKTVVETLKANLDQDAWTIALAKEVLSYVWRSHQVEEMAAIVHERPEPVMDILHKLDGIPILPCGARQEKLCVLRCPRTPDVPLLLFAPEELQQLLPDIPRLVHLDSIPYLRDVWEVSTKQTESNLEPLNLSTLVSSGLLKSMLPKHWYGHSIVFFATKESSVAGSRADYNAAMTAVRASNRVDAVESEGRANSKRAQKKQAKKAKKAQREMNSRNAKLRTKQQQSDLKPGDGDVSGAATPDKVPVVSQEEFNHVLDRLGLIWSIIENHSAEVASVQALQAALAPFPLVVLNEGYVCTLDYAQARLALCSWGDNDRVAGIGTLQLARAFGVLTFQPSTQGSGQSVQATLLHRGRRNLFEAVKKSLDHETWYNVNICESLATLVVEALQENSESIFAVMPSVSRYLPIYLTLGGRYSSLEGGFSSSVNVSEYKVKELIQVVRPCWAPTRKDEEIFSAGLAKYFLLASGTERLDRLLEGSGISPMHDYFEFAASFIVPIVERTYFMDEISQDSSLHIFHQIASLKLQRSKLETTRGRRILSMLSTNPFVVSNNTDSTTTASTTSFSTSAATEGELQRKCCKDFIDPNDRHFRELFSSTLSEAELTAMYPPKAYRSSPAVLALMRKCGMQSMEQPTCFLRAANMIVDSQNVSSSHLLVEYLVRNWDLLAKWNRTNLQELEQIPFVAVRKLGANFPSDMVLRLETGEIDRRLMAWKRQGQRVRMAGAKSSKRNQINDLLDAELWRHRDGSETLEDTEEQDSFQVYGAAMQQAKAFLQDARASLEKQQDSVEEPEWKFIALSAQRGNQTIGKIPAALQAESLLCWSRAYILPECCDKAPASFLTTFPWFHPPHALTIAQHLSTCGKFWNQQTTEWRLRHLGLIKAVVLACCANLSKPTQESTNKTVHRTHANRLLANTPFVIFDDGSLFFPANVCVDLDEDLSKTTRAIPDYLKGFETFLVSIGSPSMNDMEAPDVHVSSRFSVENILHGIKSSFNDETLADLVFVIGERRFFAHRLILSFASPVFGTLYSLHSRDSNERLHKVTMPDWVVPEAMEALLRYVYTGSVQANVAEGSLINLTVSEKNVELVLSLMQLADMYAFHHLKQLCEVWISKSEILDVYNVCAFLTHAHGCNAEQLFRLCVFHIREMFDVVKHVPDFAALPQDLKDRIVSHV